MSARLMAVVAEGKKGRMYLPPSVDQESHASDAAIYLKQNFNEINPPQQIARGTFASNAQGRRYCFQHFSDYFMPRQLIALTALCDLIPTVKERILSDITASESDAPSHVPNPDDKLALHAGGAASVAYSDAVVTYLGFCIDRAAEYGSALSTWLPDDNAIRGTFGRQAVSMAWDYCEGSYFGDSSAALSTITSGR
jgi:putative DNA methylase